MKLDDLDNLKNAATLAEFANLSPARIDDFRQKHPKFFPATFWKTAEVSDDSDLALGARRSKRAVWQEFQAILHEAWVVGFDDASLAIVLVQPVAAMGRFELTLTITYPYQRAVLWLYTHSGLARLCRECKNRFVADVPGRQFCSTKCNGEHQRAKLSAQRQRLSRNPTWYKKELARKRRWWKKHGSKRRAQRKKAVRNSKGRSVVF